MSTKLYTRTGDDGTTFANQSTRTTKDDLLIEVYGCIDELNSSLGLVLAHENISDKLQTILKRTQQELCNLAKELYEPSQSLITAQQMKQIEQDIDNINAKLPELTTFILPDGNLVAATCHLARTICRRTERRLVTLNKDKKINPIILQYINRLSDLLFACACHFWKMSAKFGS